MTTETAAPAAPADATQIRDDKGQFTAPVSTEPIAPPPATPDLNPRNRAMADIVARRTAEVAEEMGADVTGAPPTDFEPAPDAPAPQEAAAPAMTEDGVTPPPAPASEPVAAAPAAPAPSAPAVPQIDPAAEYTFIVNGQPVKMKGSQVVARVQKDEAVDQNLALASQILREARAQAQQPPGPSAPDVRQPSAPPAAGKTDAQLAQDLQFGTTEQAAEAIAEIRRRDSNAVTQEGLQQFISRQLPAVVNDTLDVRDAAQFARTEYADLLADPYLEPLFKMEVAKALQAGNGAVSRTEACKNVGESIRQHFNRPKPGAAAPIQQPQQPPKTLEQRREAKASAPPAPKLASARLDGGSAPVLTPEQAREKSIQAMRDRTRGQRQARPG